MSQKIIQIKTIPFAGGVDLAHESSALPNGGLSQDQNFRPRRPGKESRLGQAKHHTLTETAWITETAYVLFDFVAPTTENGFQYECTVAGTADVGEPTWPTTVGDTVSDGTVTWTCRSRQIISLYGFSKSEISEQHLFAQYDNGNVKLATDNPPNITTGDFGSSVLAARSNPWPASWAKFRDMLIYTDGVDMGQIYTGQNMKPVVFNVYKGTGPIPDIPEEGADYTQEMIDGLNLTRADLGDLDTLANDNALFVGFDAPVNKITINVPNANGNTSVATLAYRKNDSTWADASATDGTILSGASLGQSGSFTWSLPTDEVPHYAFGRSCFIYRIIFSAALDSVVDVSSITGENTEGFQDIQNVWSGIMPDATMAVVQDTSASTFATYSSQSILCGDLVGGASHDYIYISSPDRLFGIYLNVEGTPNTTASTAIDEVATWTGEAFVALSSLSTNTGGAKTGFITWQRNSNTRRLNFNGTVEHAYWYRIRFNQTLSSSLAWKISTLPYFDMNEIYPVMQAACAWDNRMWYSFNDNILYGTDILKPMTLNGDNLVVVEAAKHSKNKAICMKRFYQFMLVWGEEKGEEGGYFSVVQPGATASGYAAQVMSEKIGIMNSKCAVTIEDAYMADFNTDRPLMKGVFFLSRNGVYKSNGGSLKNISGPINNYFDPTRSECIRRGFEKEHFLSWDSVYGIIRLGLVSGSSAEVPNKFFIFDTTSNTWHEDVLGQPLSSIAEIDAASGVIPVVQCGGGQDGYVYRLNTGDSDVATAIDKSLKIELDGEGHTIRLKGMAILMKAQTAGNIIVEIFRKGQSAADLTKTLAMQNANADYKGHRFLCDVSGDHLTVKISNSVAGQPVYLLEYGFDVDKTETNIAYD